MSFSFGEIWLVTSGACTPSTTSVRTVMAMSRLRRHRIGSSWAYSILAICCSGTATPLRDVTVRSPTRPRSSRSDGTARAITPTFSMPSRIVVPGDDHDLGKGLVRQLRIEAEPEPRRALADIGRIGRDILVVLQQRFRGL